MLNVLRLGSQVLQRRKEHQIFHSKHVLAGDMGLCRWLLRWSHRENAQTRSQQQPVNRQQSEKMYGGGSLKI